MIWRVWNMYLYCFSKSYYFFCIRTETLYQYCFCICTVLLYRYCFPVLWYLLNYYLTPTLNCYYLTPVWYHLSPTILNTWHTWLIIITYGNDDLISWHTLIYPVQHVLIIHLTCSCLFPYTSNYLVNYKNDNLHRDGRNWWILVWCYVYSGRRTDDFCWMS